MDWIDINEFSKHLKNNNPEVYQKLLNGDVFVPRNINTLKDLSGTSKLLLCDILTECIINNEFSEINKATISSKTKTHENRAYNKLKELKDKGYIKHKLKFSREQIYNILSKKDLKKQGIGNSICQWCNGKTICPEDHHYPIAKLKGGTETVSICPTCHREFHSMEKIKIITINLNKINIPIQDI